MATLTFGEFELDEAERSLRLNGEALPVQPLVLSFLGYLARHAGRVVPKGELMDVLWPGVHVTEASLQRAASLARTALKAGGMAAALRSIPRFGYRFALDRATLVGVGPTERAPALPVVERAREAAKARDWVEAGGRFAEADRIGRLGPEDLDLWAYALECQGQLKAVAPLYARAVEGHMGRNAPYGAARSAVGLSKAELELGHVDAGRAWILRAEEILGEEGPPEIEAYLLWMKSRFTAFDGDCDQSLALARRAVELAEAANSPPLRALAIAYEGFYSMTLGDVASGRARQDQAAAAGLSSELDPLTGSLIYCSILWTCRTFADWSRAAQWSPGFELWCEMAFAGVTGACRLHNADIIASVGRLDEALREIDRAIEMLIEEDSWELGDAYRVRGDIRAMMGEAEAARADYQLSISVGWDVEPGLAQLRAEAGDVAGALASLDRSLAGRSWYARQRRGWLLANKARIAAAAGMTEVARSALDELDISPDAAPTSAIQAMSMEARGETLACDGRVPEAMSELRAARQVWIGIRHVFHAARLHLRIADLMEQNGDGESARLERGAALLAASRIGAHGLLASVELDSAA